MQTWWCSLHEVRTANVPAWHSLELTGSEPAYHIDRGTAATHNQVVYRELDMMLKAGIITPAT